MSLHGSQPRKSGYEVEHAIYNKPNCYFSLSVAKELPRCKGKARLKIGRRISEQG